MVKTYDRFEPGPVLGLVASNSTIISLPGGSAGRVAVGAAEFVQIWDLKTGQQVSRFHDSAQDPKAQVSTLTYDANSQLIAAGYTDGSIRVWDQQSGTALITFNGHKSTVSVLRFDASGTRLYSGGFDTHIVAWDLVEEVGLFRLRGHKSNITALELVEDSWLLSTSKDGLLKLWDLDSQFAVESHMAHKNECWAASVQGVQLVTGNNGTELKLWNIDLSRPDGHKVTTFGVLEKQSRHRPVSLKIKDDSLYCASADAVQIWTQRTAEELKKVLKRKQKRSQKKDEQKYKEKDNEVELTAADVFIQKALLRPSAKVYSLSVLESDRIALNLANNSIEAWSLAKDKDEPERVHILEFLGHRTDVRDVAISSDRKLLMSGSNGMIKLYNVKTMNVIRTVEGTGYILALKFLPGDSLAVVGTKEGAIDLYDLTTSTLVESFPAHEGSVWSLDLSEDGKTLISGGADKTVKFWELRVVDKEVVGQPGLMVPSMHLKNTHKLEFNDEVLAVKLSPNGKLVAASLLDNTVKVYYRETLKFFLNLYGHQLPVLSIDISHDNKMLVSSSADKNIKIWGLDFGDVHKSIFAHDDSILRVVFDPHTHNFFSASKDGLVKYWDGDKFTQIQKLAGHHGEVWALAAANDGSFVASASHDKSLRIWDRTDEPLFVEEEREAELEQEYEQNLVESLDRDLQQSRDADGGEDDSQAVARHTLDSLKAGERLYEALQLATADLDARVAGSDEPRHIILSTLNVSAEQYLMDTLVKTKNSMVEDALLTFPLESIASLLRFVLLWLQNQWNLVLVCRVLFFVLRTFHKQLVANRMLRPQLEEIVDLLQTELDAAADRVGFNVAYLRYVKETWDMNRVHDFDDETPEDTKKRAFPTLDV